MTAATLAGNSRISTSQQITSVIRTSGSAIITQVPNGMWMPAFCSAASAIALGGVPIGVAMPPMLAPIGIASTTAIRAGSVSGMRAKIGRITVIIIAVVAVLLMKAESTAVASNNPNTIMAGRSPTGFKKSRVIARSSRYFTDASARRQPPRNRMMMGSASAAKKLRYAVGL